MTNYSSLTSSKIENKTVFEKYVDGCMGISNAMNCPDEYKNVLHLGKDETYGDVFKAWDNDPNEFIIFFGTAGDEFK